VTVLLLVHGVQHLSEEALGALEFLEEDEHGHAETECDGDERELCSE